MFVSEAINKITAKQAVKKSLSDNFVCPLALACCYG